MGQETGTSMTTACLNRLAPCLSFLNGTDEPPRSCCQPLKSVIQSDAQCLCSIVSNEGARQAEQAGININDAQTLPARCGQRVNLLTCLANSPAGSQDSAQNSAAKSMHMSQGLITILLLSSSIFFV
ncbi:lipid transfer-like protein VAS [Senna tora]|uniref:Lipid transfer-like protein VAS n=1 Tax=Senna tora TaxID=362788 RepID=A0A834SED2_9FABA|nr:lipid transfer-like protein VAS [Senna tora]